MKKSIDSDFAETASSIKKPRLNSVDILRGIAMVLMALDHVRDYFTNSFFDPLDLEQTSMELFLTRWITHFCAPVFVFLAGTGAYLSLGRGKSKTEVSKFLLSRGLWLIFLEFTIVRLGWTFGFDYSIILAMVIWVIGVSMIFLAILIHFPIKAVAAFSLIMIFAHNLFDGITPEQLGAFSWLWIILHNFDIINLGSGYSLFIAYPLIPWIGVMSAGYCFGTLYNLEPDKRKKIFLYLGSSMIILFIVLRLLDFYGDFNKWTVQQNFVFTLLDFIDTTKYPPSLLFLLITLGPAILLLAFLDKAKDNGIAASFFVVFGRVPLFYYIIHIPFIHALALITASIAGIDASFMLDAYPFFWESGTGWGFSLLIVYMIWILVVLALYPLCRWYNNYKKKNKSPWLSYL